MASSSVTMPTVWMLIDIWHVLLYRLLGEMLCICSSYNIRVPLKAQTHALWPTDNSKLKQNLPLPSPPLPPHTSALSWNSDVHYLQLFLPVKKLSSAFECMLNTWSLCDFTLNQHTIRTVFVAGKVCRQHICCCRICLCKIKCSPGDMQYAQKLTNSWLLFCALHIISNSVRILNQHRNTFFMTLLEIRCFAENSTPTQLI